jgi:NACalpha-BTF3-like transcription factor
MESEELRPRSKKLEEHQKEAMAKMNEIQNINVDKNVIFCHDSDDDDFTRTFEKGKEKEFVDGSELEESCLFPEKDVEIVMSHSNVSRQEALKALRKNKGDIVYAIIELTQ